MFFVGLNRQFQVIQRALDVNNVFNFAPVKFRLKFKVTHSLVIIIFGLLLRNFGRVLREVGQRLTVNPRVENFLVSFFDFAHINCVIHNRRNFHFAAYRQMIIADSVPIVGKVNGFLEFAQAAVG